MIFSLITITVLRGKGKSSIIGITRCSMGDWALLFLLVSVGVILTLMAVKVLRNEYEEKVSAGYEFMPGDFECTKGNII